MTEPSMEQSPPPEAAYIPFKSLPREKFKRLISYFSPDDEESLRQQIPELPHRKPPPVGRLEKVFPQIGGAFLFGFSAGGAYGIMEGRASIRSLQGRIRLMQILNNFLKRGKSCGNKLGVIALLYCTVGVLLQLTRSGEDDAWNSVASGGITGMMVGSSKGLRQAAAGGAIGIALSSLHVLIDRIEWYKPTASSVLAEALPNLFRKPVETNDSIRTHSLQGLLAVSHKSFTPTELREALSGLLNPLQLWLQGASVVHTRM
ncbi:mitochondrial import inner membrane translocase subunit Tim23-like [Ochlerotatus camptorhynchus]|uniref:mitochondrial import inner membrane translocase subunit Tim23-like n=1 Tax=Ochlerotatus camptorhynchus TaxID=644619 RepID=UPI0031E350BF